MTTHSATAVDTAEHQRLYGCVLKKPQTMRGTPRRHSAGL